MNKPLAFDLFSGAGGAAIGLKAAGFYVIGFDIKRPSSYAGDEFVQADIHSLPVKDLKQAAFVWASPPCQEFSEGSRCRKSGKKDYPNLVPQTRSLLHSHPFTCIENVSSAPLRSDLILNGATVGLPFITRKRIFELSWFMLKPVLLSQPKIVREKGFTVSVCKSSSNNKQRNEKRRRIGLKSSVPQAVRKTVMGIPYFTKMTNAEIGEAVPPAYSEYIAREALRQM